MPTQTHHQPTVDEVRKQLQDKGVRLACTVCDAEEFTIDFAAVKESGHNYYGNVRLNRAQLSCRNCGHVMSFDMPQHL